MFVCPALNQKYFFRANLDQKIKTICVQIEIWYLNNLNMLRLMVMFTCPVMDRKKLYWTNLVQKLKCLFKLKVGI